MGQLHLAGPGATAAVEWLVSCHAASLRPGRVRYGCCCNEAGGVVDDVTVYRLGDDALVPVRERARTSRRTTAGSCATPRRGVEVRDRSAETGLLALQGPASAAVLARAATRRSAPCPASRSPARSSAAPRPWSRAPATRAATASSSTARAATRSRSGTRCSPPAPRTASCRPGSARATRCASRRRSRSTVTSSTTTTSPLEARLDRFVKQDGRRLPRRRRDRAAPEGRPPQAARGLRAHRARHRARRLRARSRGRGGRRRHVGSALSHSRKIDRARLRSARLRRAGHASRGESPRPRDCRAGGRDAVRPGAGAGFE